MVINYCMEALVSGVLLAGDINLIHSNNNLYTINENAIVIADSQSMSANCQNDRIVKTQPSIKDKIYSISSK